MSFRWCLSIRSRCLLASSPERESGQSAFATVRQCSKLRYFWLEPSSIISFRGDSRHFKNKLSSNSVYDRLSHIVYFGQCFPSQNAQKYSETDKSHKLFTFRRRDRASCDSIFRCEFDLGGVSHDRIIVLNDSLIASLIRHSLTLGRDASNNYLLSQFLMSQ